MPNGTHNQAPTVLVVEDDWLLREMVCDYLRDAGWNVFEAASGEEALDRLDDEEDIDIVFTDIRLDGALNGWDVGEACRRKTADFPVIYTTGNTINPPRRVDGSLLVSKPYDPEEIRVACEQMTAARGTRAH
jgi:CheY-like chemotaxis protein